MSRPPFSPSGVGPTRACLASAVLPAVPETTAATSFGTNVRHRFFERVPQVGREAALAEISDPAGRAAMAAMELDGMPLDPAAYAQEVSFAWDWEKGTAREVGRGLSRGARDAMLGPTEVGGTADIAALLGDDGAYIGDIKAEFDPQPPAEQHDQLHLLALMAARAWGREWVKIEIIRPRKGEPAWRDAAELDLFALTDIAERMRALALAVLLARAEYEKDGIDPPAHVGDWCRRCHSRHACSAIGGALARVAEPNAIMITDENAPAVYELLSAVRARADELWELLKQHARQSPIRLPDGRVFGPKMMNFDVIDGAKLWRVLADMHGEAVAWAAAQVEITKSRLDEALTPIALARGPRKLAEVRREVIAAASAAGAWSVVRDAQVRLQAAPKSKALPGTEDAT